MRRKVAIRSKFLIPVAACSLLVLGLGLGFGFRYWTAPSGAPRLGADALQTLVRRYTTHPALAAQGAIVPIRISEAFTANDRAKIVLAVGEWNYALNGAIRLQVAPAGSAATPPVQPPQTWRIEALKGGLSPSSAWKNGEMLAVTEPFPGAGGIMIVFTDRVGTRDLHGIVLHELGHVLGLPHDPHGQLMSIRYSESNEQCIDKPAMEAVAADHKLTLADLNWCETGVANVEPPKVGVR
jgi:hypothetical protein